MNTTALWCYTLQSLHCWELHVGLVWLVRWVGLLVLCESLLMMNAGNTTMRLSCCFTCCAASRHGTFHSSSSSRSFSTKRFHRLEISRECIHVHSVGWAWDRSVGWLRMVDRECLDTWNRRLLLIRSEIVQRWKQMELEIWANAQPDGRPAEYKWRPLFNAAMFGWRPLLECRAVTLPRRKTRWNL